MIAIRGFKAADAQAVSSLIGETMRRSNGADYSMDVLQPLINYFSPQKVQQLALERRCLVAEEDGKIVGTISLDGCELCTFFVHPDCQGRGVGSQLMSSLEADAVAAGVAVMHVDSSITGVPFYRARGYAESGVEIDGAAGRQIGMTKRLSACLNTKRPYK